MQIIDIVKEDYFLARGIDNARKPCYLILGILRHILRFRITLVVCIVYYIIHSFDQMTRALNIPHESVYLL